VQNYRTPKVSSLLVRELPLVWTMPVSEDQVTEALRGVKYPGFSRDIISFGLLRGIRIDAGAVTVQLVLTTNEPAIPQRIKSEAEETLRGIAGVKQAK